MIISVYTCTNKMGLKLIVIAMGEDCSHDYLWHSRRGIMAGMMITSDGVIKYIGDTLNKLRTIIFSQHQSNEMYMLRIDSYSVNLGIDYGSHIIVLCGYHGIHLGTGNDVRLGDRPVYMEIMRNFN